MKKDSLDSMPVPPGSVERTILEPLEKLTTENADPDMQTKDSEDRDPTSMINISATKIDVSVRPEMLWTTPSVRQRELQRTVIPSLRQSWTFESRETLFKHDGGADQQIKHWSVHTHPDGLLYFSRRTECGRIRFVTEENLYNPGTNFLEELDVLVDHVASLDEDFDLGEQALPPSESTGISVKSKSHSETILVDICFENDDGSWYYYMVDHRKRRPFWLEQCDLSWFANRIGGVSTKAHLAHMLDHEYWLHVEHFPHDLDLPEEALDEVLGTLLFAGIDASSSAVSISFCEPEEASRFKEFVENFQHYNKKKALQPFANAAAARLLSVFAYNRFTNFSGHFGARISRTQSVRAARRGKSIMFRLLSILLLFAPSSYVKDLEEMWIDLRVHRSSWTLFKSTTEKQWRDVVLYATVLLAVNMSFLALAAVSQDPGTEANASQIISQVSVIQSTGSVIVGLLLLRQYSLIKEGNMGEVKVYFLRHTGQSSNVEWLAIMYSLPFALLFWGMISFLAAIAVTCFDVVGNTQRIVNAVAWSFVVVAIVWTIASGSGFWRGSFKGMVSHIFHRIMQ